MKIWYGFLLVSVSTDLIVFATWMCGFVLNSDFLVNKQTVILKLTFRIVKFNNVFTIYTVTAIYLYD